MAKQKPVVVFVAGTFDGLHAGHVKLFEFARKKGAQLQRKLKRRGTKLHVIVARDSSVRKWKGKPPVQNERERLSVVSALKGVNAAMLGHPSDFFESVRKIRPDLIVLGHDQGGAQIVKRLSALGFGLVVRCKPFNRARLHSRNLRERKFHKNI
jgi:cytidyltransferase-like protein